jgi:hypothetical protein
MPIRNPFVNPFTKRPAHGGEIYHDENMRPEQLSPKDANAGFERVDTVGSKASSVLSIRSTRSQDTGDYKLSGELQPTLTLIRRHADAVPRSR